MADFIPIDAAASAYAQTARRTAAAAESVEDTPAFAALLKNELLEAVQAGERGEQVALSAVAGQASLQEVVEAVTEAEVGLQTVTALRDRAVSAYQEILRMPI